MPWIEVTPIDHRLQFVAEAKRTDEAFTALFTRYSVAAKTSHRWLAHYAAEGAAGPHNHSRRPRSLRSGKTAAHVPGVASDLPLPRRRCLST